VETDTFPTRPIARRVKICPKPEARYAAALLGNDLMALQGPMLLFEQEEQHDLKSSVIIPDIAV